MVFFRKKEKEKKSKQTIAYLVNNVVSISRVSCWYACYQNLSIVIHGNQRFPRGKAA